MILDPDCLMENHSIDMEDAYLIVDKDKNPELFLKSIVIYFNTQRAKILRDYLDEQIKECPRDDTCVGLLLHTGWHPGVISG